MPRAEGVGGGKPPPNGWSDTPDRGSADFMLNLAHFWLPFGSLWLPLAPFWLPFGSLWLPFGSIWLALGSLLVLLGSLLLTLVLNFHILGVSWLHFSYLFVFSIEVLCKILFSENVH